METMIKICAPGIVVETTREYIATKIAWAVMDSIQYARQGEAMTVCADGQVIAEVTDRLARFVGTVDPITLEKTETKVRSRNPESVIPITRESYEKIRNHVLALIWDTIVGRRLSSSEVKE